MKTKTLKMMLLALGVLLSLNANAYDYQEIGEISYELDPTSGTAKVHSGRNCTGKISIPASVYYRGT